MVLTAEDSTTTSTKSNSSSSSGDEIPKINNTRETRSKNKRTRTSINNTTMRKAKDKSSSSPDIDESILASNNYDLDCLNTTFPVEMEMDLLCSIFSLGLKESSPKILLDLMPKNCGLSNEHIKSHLQKYRIHNERSREEFLLYWSESMQSMYLEWENQQDWNNNSSGAGSLSLSSSSSNNNSNNMIHLDPTLMELASQAAG